MDRQTDRQMDVQGDSSSIPNPNFICGGIINGRVTVLVHCTSPYSDLSVGEV